MGERVPQHVQNIVIKDFCQKRNLNFMLSVSEYAMENSSLILKDLLNNLSGLHGIAAYSVFQMPVDDKERQDIFEKILRKKKKIFFACENLEISKKEDITRIENLWLVKKASLKLESKKSKQKYD
jgi:sporadic carbohydrate cluster protein (TIGR04323 family)